MWGTEAAYIEWAVPCTTLYASIMSKTVKKLMTMYISQRTTLNGIMTHPWVNMGQEEELKPYRGLPWGDINPHMIEIMKNLKFKQHKIQESVTKRQYNNIMGTYLILHTTENKMKGHSLKVRPYPSLDSTAVFPHPEKFGHQDRKPVSLQILQPT